MGNNLRGEDSARLATRQQGATSQLVASGQRRNVIQSLPRRAVVVERPEEAAMPPMAKVVQLQASGLRALFRFVRLLVALMLLALGNLADVVLNRSSLERRAQRLRRLMEGGGPALLRIGHHLTVRSDLLPTPYCEALGELRDVARPFPTKEAIALIEQAAGRRLSEVYAVFDPEPIASTSIACVFQAILPNGEQVGIKVRRPNIGKQLGAELKAFGWLLVVVESAGLLRQGRARALREELRLTLAESLNFVLEARYNEIFASKAKKKQQDHIQAPQVHFDLSNEMVLVTEFVSGVFLWEIVEAVEQNDEAVLAELSERGIDPVLIAKRLTRSFYWEALENIFFHADPSPTKIVARSDNSLVFIDFSSCGRFSDRIKRYYQQLQNYIEREDVGGMVDATISMLEPLPPIDLERFTKEVEGVYWDWLYATKSRHAEWWERTAGELWLKIVDVARRFRVPVHLDVLRMFRATLVYDSVAMRLWGGLKLSKEYQNYSKERGRRARRRVRRTLRRRMERGASSADYLALQDLSRLLTQIVNRGQHVLDRPAHRFAGMISKAAFGVSMVLRVVLIGTTLHVLAVASATLVLRGMGRAVDLRTAIDFVVRHPAYQVTIAFLLLILIRRALMRLEDIDVDGQ